MPRNVSNVPILVAGMHRSGTSAVATLLGGSKSATGELGPKADFANPAGYAEVTPIVELNRAALLSKGWFWDAPPALPPGDDSVSAEVVDSGRALIDEYQLVAGGVFKDPRFSLLMPLWRRILVDRLVVVVPVRPALEVAWSLAMRDGFSMSLGIALWNAYHRHLAAGLSGLGVVVVDYPTLVEEPATTIEHLADALRVLGAQVDVDIAAAARGIRPELRRTSVPADVKNAYVAPQLDALVPGMSTGPVTVLSMFDLTAANPQPWEIDILDEHRARRRELAEARAQLQGERRRREQDVAAYAQSASWRITAPVRAARQEVRRFRPGRFGKQTVVDAREVALDAVALTSVVGLWPLAKASRGYRRLTGAMRRPKPDRS